MSDWNDRVIEEFRANSGVVGGAFTGSRLMLLTTVGARSGLARTTPVAFTVDGDARILVASKAGSTSHPAWFANLTANPRVHVEESTATGIDEYDAVASLYPEGDREAKFQSILDALPAFAPYWGSDGKVIPLVVLRRVPES